MDAKTAVASSATTPTVAPSSTVTKPKPCCVCKEEKSKRDECMLFSTAKDPALDCVSLVDSYKKCMAGFGYTV
ncbi:cytochrome C oxidase copper chaperone-domain-containing protein [Stachybotrys elegans]|uniref:Cytochrome C oxidase copper chaperone-domain-containing protein n=1 Tax=Stachybotrys elegans TaxID=80388 RepID=A0A8K0T5U0_9HYPO|nr:cytochrome C oxidase copper chaperone-domain-containing protein [Stachybotrys elegans]